MEEMVYGGQWLAEGGTGTPHYVVNPDHVARMLREGYQIIADPRITEPEQSAEPEQEPEKDEEPEDDDTTRRLTTTKAANKSRARSVDTTL